MSTEGLVKCEAGVAVGGSASAAAISLGALLQKHGHHSLQCNLTQGSPADYTGEIDTPVMEEEEKTLPRRECD